MRIGNTFLEPMDTDELIALILSLPDVRRSTQADLPEFRVAGRLFARLPSQRHLALGLTVDQQRQVVDSDPGIFSPATGDQGARGWTDAAIGALDKAAALSALAMAWANAAPRGRADAPDARRGRQ